MSKKAKKRSPARATKKSSKPPVLKTLLKGILRFFEEELPVTQFQGSGKYEAQVAEVKAYQPALEAICGGRSAKAKKHVTTAVITPEARSETMRVTIDEKLVGQLKPTDARFLQKQLAKAGLELCSIKVSALIEGGQRKKNGEEEDFTVRLSLPPKPQKKQAAIVGESAREE